MRISVDRGCLLTVAIREASVRRWVPAVLGECKTSFPSLIFSEEDAKIQCLGFRSKEPGHGLLEAPPQALASPKDRQGHE